VERELTTFASHERSKTLICPQEGISHARRISHIAYRASFGWNLSGILYLKIGWQVIYSNLIKGHNFESNHVNVMVLNLLREKFVAYYDPI